MKHFGLRALLVFLPLCLVSCGSGSRPCILDCQKRRAEQIDPVKALELMGFHGYWQDIPVIVQADKKLTASQIDKIKIAARQWNDFAGIELIRIEEDQFTYDQKSCYKDWLQQTRNVIAIVEDWTCSGKYNAVLGTTVWSKEPGSDVFIQHAGVYLNGDHYSFERAELNNDVSSRKGFVDLGRLITHEFGHLLGLQHVYDDDSVMNPSLYIEGEYELPYLSPRDSRTIKSIYHSPTKSIGLVNSAKISKKTAQESSLSSAQRFCDI